MKISQQGRWVSPLAFVLCLSAAGCDDVANLVQAPARAPSTQPSHVAANGPVRLHPGDKVRVKETAPYRYRVRLIKRGTI